MAPTQQQSKQTKAKQLAGAKPPKARVARYLKKHSESQLVEGAKSTLLLKGISCSHAMTTILKDIRAMKAPYAKLLSKNNVILPFDDGGQMSLEFLSTKNDCSLICLASHNKKRPNNLVLGRMFDRHVLDMVELGVIRYKSIADYPSCLKKRIGSKPMMLFVGDMWHLNQECKKLQNLLIDFYRGDPVDKIVLSGLDHIMVFTALEDTNVGFTQKDGNDGGHDITRCIIHQRTYFCKMKKNPNGSRAPLPYLTPSGPDMDFHIRRAQFAPPDLYKQALKQPSATKSKKVKNQSTNLFGETIGRLHLEKQDLDKMGGRKSKALRVSHKLEKEAERQELESELDREREEIGREFQQTYGFANEE